MKLPDNIRISINAVGGFDSALGKEMLSVLLEREGLTPESIGTKAMVAAQRFRKKGKNVSDKLLSEVIKLGNDGIRGSQIALKLGIARSTALLGLKIAKARGLIKNPSVSR